jgi:hypothetical protein
MQVARAFAGICHAALTYSEMDAGVTATVAAGTAYGQSRAVFLAALYAGALPPPVSSYFAHRVVTAGS